MKVIDDQREIPSFFSKASILFLSTFFGSLFGAFVYISNLQAVNKKHLIFPTILSIAIVNGFVISKIYPILSSIPFPILYPLLNAFSSLLLIGPFWNYHLKEHKVYDTNSIWGPLAAGVLIFGGFIAIGFYLKSVNG